MPYYAQINDQNIVTAVSELSGIVDLNNMIELSSMDGSLLGQRYENGNFVPVAPPPLSNIITKIAFLTRFTDQEFVAVVTMSKTDPEVEVWKIKFDSSTTIDLSDVRTQTGINMLVTKGLLTQVRADTILNTPPQLSERP